MKQTPPDTAADAGLHDDDVIDDDNDDDDEIDGDIDDYDDDINPPWSIWRTAMTTTTTKMMMMMTTMLAEHFLSSGKQNLPTEPEADAGFMRREYTNGNYRLLPIKDPKFVFLFFSLSGARACFCFFFPILLIRNWLDLPQHSVFQQRVNNAR